MPYDMINGTALGNDLSYFFVYLNSVTGGWFVPLMMLSFFLIVFISSVIFQLRFSSRIRPESSFAASSFATFGLMLILSQKSGLLNPIISVVIVGISIFSIVWLVLSSE